jgi:hypothetical protein
VRFSERRMQFSVVYIPYKNGGLVGRQFLPFLLRYSNMN